MNRYFMDPHPVQFTRRIGGISAPTVRHVWHVKDKERPTEFGNHKSVANSGNPYVAQRICDMLNGQTVNINHGVPAAGVDSCVKVTHLGHTAEYWHGLFEARGQDMDRMKAQRDDAEQRSHNYKAQAHHDRTAADSLSERLDDINKAAKGRTMGVPLTDYITHMEAHISQFDPRTSTYLHLRTLLAQVEKQRDEYAAKCEGLATPEAIRSLENLVDDARATSNHLANERNQARADVNRLEKEVADAQINAADAKAELKTCERLNSEQNTAIGNLRAAYELTRAELRTRPIGWTAKEVSDLMIERDALRKERDAANKIGAFVLHPSASTIRDQEGHVWFKKY